MLELSGQLAQLLEKALKPVFADLVAETKQVLSEAIAPLKKPKRESKPKPKRQTENSSSEESLQPAPLLEELARLVDEPVESLRRNPNLSNALAEHHEGASDAMLYFKQATATWKKKPGLGLFISALKKGLKPSPTAPGGGWGDWSREAMQRRLMEYSQSWEGDIMVHFIGGLQKLWSEVKSLEWSELEALVAAPCS